MIDRGRIAEIIRGPDNEILVHLPTILPGLTTPEIFDLLELMEDSKIFKGRLPLRLKLYAKISQTAPQPSFQLLALLRLLRRLGSRKDIPDLGEIPEKTDDFADYLVERAVDLCEDESLATAVGALAMATRAYRRGELKELEHITPRGLDALREIDSWADPPEIPDLTDLAVAETGHELNYIAGNAAFRRGDVVGARSIAEDWSEKINSWEHTLGRLARQRYQYFQLVGHINQEVGTYESALEAYTKALEYAPTPYRKAFLWLGLAQIERNLDRKTASWDHASMAIDALLESPYPQVAANWIEWLGLDADTEGKKAVIEDYRLKLETIGGIDINRVTRAMTDLYRLLASLRAGDDPTGIAPVLGNLVVELEEMESWPNLVILLSTQAVVAGRLNDREAMDRIIEKARGLIASRLAPDARPPAEFLLECAHALALRDVGAYGEAFNTLFERALEARRKYPGGFGPEERTALEAFYYLGALAGYDPDTIEKRIRDTISDRG